MTEHDNRKHDLVKNTAIIAFGGLSVQLAQFLLLPLYTAYLPKSDYGTLDLITTYSTLLGPILTLQLGMAAFRFLVDARGNDTAITRVITTTLQTTVLLLLASGAIFLIVAQFINISYALLIAINIAIGSVMGVFMQFARGLGDNKVFTIAGIIAGGMTVVLNIMALVVFNSGVNGILISTAIGSLAALLYIVFKLKLYKYIKPHTNNKGLRTETLKYSLPLVPNGVSWWFINAIDRTIIAIFLGLSANGVYAIAYKFPIVFTTIFSFFALSWTESASLHIDSKDRDKFFSETTNATILFFGSLAALMVAGVSLVFKFFVNISFGEAYNYIPILIAASFFSSIVAMYGAIYIAKKQTKQIATTTIFAAIINIVLCVALIKFIGLYGTAIAATVAFLVMAIYRHHDSKQYVNTTYNPTTLVKVTLLFTFATILYYIDSFAVHFANVLFVGIATILLNKSFLLLLKDRFSFPKQKYIPLEQESVKSPDFPL